MRIAFVWFGISGRYGQWKDGLWRAMKRIEENTGAHSIAVEVWVKYADGSRELVTHTYTGEEFNRASTLFDTYSGLLQDFINIKNLGGTVPENFEEEIINSTEDQ